jgi:hypothetical protein
MTLSVVQHTGSPEATSAASVAFTLGTTPVAGNILVAFCAYSYPQSCTITPPSGSWHQVDKVATDPDGLAVYWYVVQSGDTSGPWTFGLSPSATKSGEMYEVTGADTTTPVNQHLMAGVSSNPQASPSRTPSILGCLALVCWAEDGGPTPSGVTSGWTLDETRNGGYHSSYSASKNVLTADTTTAVTCTITFGGNDSGWAETLLIAPGITAVTATAGPASGTGSAPAAVGLATSALVYAGSGTGLAGGSGTWVNPGNATGTDDGTYSTWAVP